MVICKDVVIRKFLLVLADFVRHWLRLGTYESPSTSHRFMNMDPQELNNTAVGLK